MVQWFLRVRPPTILQIIKFQILGKKELDSLRKHIDIYIDEK